MKALISYSKRSIEFNDTHVEMEFGGVGESRTFVDEYGTHHVRLVKVIKNPAPEKIGCAVYRIEFANGNVYESTCVVRS